MTIQVGAKAPQFKLPAAGGATVSLAQFKGQPVIVYFYPKDDTPGCTKEACAFNDLHAQLAKLKAVVIGISKDDVKSHDKFVAKYGLKFHLASDAESDVCEQYGVWVEKSMYGKTYMGIERTTFLIDGSGVVKQVWNKVKVDGHDQEVLAALKAL